jgi:hypothetical protein
MSVWWKSGMSLWCKSGIGLWRKGEKRFRQRSEKACREKRDAKCSTPEKAKSNYAINATPEQALRTNRAILPARVIAALAFMSRSSVNPRTALDWIDSALWLHAHGAKEVPDAEELVAYLDLIDCATQEPERAWSTICEICELPEAKDVLGLVGAGPLEDLLMVHGAMFIERVTAQARKSILFRFALSGTWKSGMSEDVWEKVQGAVQEA